MKCLLVTGGCGFIGSNFVRHILEKGGRFVVNLDKLTYAGNLNNLSDIKNDKAYVFVRGDICDRPLLRSIFDKYPIDAIINFAAESHVDRSIDDPEIFLKTNILGTQALLDTAKSYWKIKPDDKYDREYRPGVKFVQISTDEVYGSLDSADAPFNERSALLPNSPYSASKTAADLVVRAYNSTYSLPVNITRCSNNYGPYQFPEKLIPLMISNCINNKNLPVYGDGLQIRDWLHVKDHCNAIETVLERGEAGEVYNIGGCNEMANIDIVKLILKELGKPESLISFVRDRPGHDRRYAVNASKIIENLGWHPSYSFDDGLAETIRWYIDNELWLQAVISGSYQNQGENLYGK